MSQENAKKFIGEADEEKVLGQKLENQKLPEEALDAVAGGTKKETGELADSIYLIQKRMDEAGEGMWSINRPQTIGTMLKKLGIEADLSEGFMGLGSKNNTYRDIQTGQMILHSEVMEFIKTGKKSWRQ